MQRGQQQSTTKMKLTDFIPAKKTTISVFIFALVLNILILLSSSNNASAASSATENAEGGTPTIPENPYLICRKVHNYAWDGTAQIECGKDIFVRENYYQEKIMEAVARESRLMAIRRTK